MIIHRRLQVTICSSFVYFLVSANAGVDWIPSFNDQPVPPARSAEIEAALPEVAFVEPKEPRRVLVVSSTAGFRHKSIPTGKEALMKMGEATSAYATVISDDPANFEPEALKTFDAVILLNTTLDFFMPGKIQRLQFNAEELEALKARQNRLMDNLVEYVEQGGGLVGIHAATDSCYNHEAYGDTIGAYFWGHPWRANSRVTIRVEDPEHALIAPVFQSLESFELVEEIYQFQEEPYSRERLRILLNLDPERSDPVDPKKIRRKDGDFPVAWVQKVGKGRVFYTSLGHNHHIFTDPMLLKHYLAGIQFACGDLPADTTPSAKIMMPNVTVPVGVGVPNCCSH
jgi:type 1 glutamine amidotransferase